MAKFPKYNKSVLDKFGTSFSKKDLAKELPNAVEDLLNKYGDEVAKRLKENLDERGSNATRSLYQSIVALPATTESGKTSVVIEINDYYKWVDKGREKGKMPPSGVIEKWLKNKPSALNKFKTSSPRGKLNLKGLDYVIRRKIAKKGTKGNEFFSDVFNKDLERAILEDLIALTKQGLILNVKENG